MDTHNHLNIDQLIDEMRAQFLDAAAPDIERYWTKVALDSLIAERDAMLAEWRARPDWDTLPF